MDTRQKKGGQMKNKLKVVIAIMISIIVIAIASIIVLVKINEGLEGQVSKRDQLLDHIEKQDSIKTANELHTQTTITKYVNSDGGLTVDGKKITLSDLINLYNQQLEENNQLITERDNLLTRISYMDDTLRVQKSLLKSIQNSYGITTKVEYSGANIISSIEGRAADSGAILLEYFRDALSYDSISRRWIIKRIVKKEN